MKRKILCFGVVLVIFSWNMTFSAGVEENLTSKQVLLEKTQELKKEIEKLRGKSINSLVEMIKDEEKSWTTREAAAILLGEIGNLNITSSLEKIYKSLIKSTIISSPYPEGELCNAIAKSIVQIEVGKNLSISEKIPLLFQIISSKHKGSIRYSGASLILEELCAEKTGIPLIIKALTNKNNHVRYQAARAIGKHPDISAVIPLITALKDKDKGVRIQTAWALGEIGDKRAVSALIKIVEDSSEDKYVHVAVIGAMGKLGDSRALDSILRLQNHKDEFVRKAVLEAVCEIGGKRSIPVLKKALKSQDSILVLKAKKALEKLGKKVERKENGYEVIE